MKTIQKILFCAIAFLLVTMVDLSAQTSNHIDTDRDGLSDETEQALAERFRPTFMISPSDCASRPARFNTGTVVPQIEAVDGTVYGQVFPSPTRPNAVEIHYYTLWARDCGRMDHPLDVEHVAALISTEGPEPHALYWYAGAHEKTVCDISSGARSQSVDAYDSGPIVWVSSGKHAMYLRKNMCHTGCGSDQCDSNVPLENRNAVVNIGELNAPANGSLWVTSPDWPLADKMDSDFNNDVLSRIDITPEGIVATLRGRSTIRGTIQGSDLVLGSAAIGATHTGSALGTAKEQTSSSLSKAASATGKSLKRAWNSIGHHGNGPK